MAKIVPGAGPARLGDDGEEKDSYIADLHADDNEYAGVDRVLREAVLSQVTAQSETVLVDSSTSVGDAVARMCASSAPRSLRAQNLRSGPKLRENPYRWG